MQSDEWFLCDSCSLHFTSAMSDKYGNICQHLTASRLQKFLIPSV